MKQLEFEHNRKQNNGALRKTASVNKRKELPHAYIMGRPKGSKNTKQLPQSTPAILPQRVVKLDRVEFLRVTIKDNGNSSTHYFDEMGNEYITIYDYESRQKRERFEAKLYERGGELHDGNTTD